MDHKDYNLSYERSNSYRHALQKHQIPMPLRRFLTMTKNLKLIEVIEIIGKNCGQTKKRLAKSNQRRTDEYFPYNYPEKNELH